MPSIADGLIERALRAAVARARTESTRARELLSALAGRRVAIVVQATPFAAVLESNGTDLRFQSLDTARAPAGAPAVDATITGTPLSLLALLAPSRTDPQPVIQRGEVRIEGDTETAQQFRELALLLPPDFENALSGMVGRSAAHVVMRGLRGATDWTRAAAWTSVQNLSEYLAHERRDLVSRAEAEHFLRGVDDLREQLDRMAARTAHLEQKTR
jgi:ubiquinone biosynthesis protein UbiJ